MGKICECGAGGRNLGQANCDAVLKSFNKMLFKDKTNADGSVAGIDFDSGNAPFNQAFWDDYLQASPMKNRYILGDSIDDFEFEQNERESLETANAVEYKVRDGHIDVTYHIFGEKGASITLYNKYKALECLNLGVNPIDDLGQVAGPMDGDEMRLIPINSLQVRYGAQMNSGEIAHIIVQFRIPHTFDWGSVKLFQPGVADINPLELMPIVDVNGTLSVSAGTSIDVTVFQDATQLGGIPLVGLGIANFDVEVNGLTEMITAITETADGEYTLTTTTVLVSTDVVTVNLVAQGFEMPELEETV
jgi:hypothetical protein